MTDLQQIKGEPATPRPGVWAGGQVARHVPTVRAIHSRVCAVAYTEGGFDGVAQDTQAATE